MDKSVLELRKYCNKLLSLIRDNATMTFFKTKLINKKRLDDIMCCIEASFPEDYKKYIKNGPRKLKSYMCYTQLLSIVNRRFWLDKTQYIVRHMEAEQCITGFLSSISADLQYISSNSKF